jgi:3-hydroxyacyl-CoA dehydrogenase/enoyl-CoA hydratase/3-hydroxybutyryl-CoA epimerase
MKLVDEVGIDVAAHVGSTLVAAFGSRVEPAPAFGKLVADGRKGKKNERGFYRYGVSAQKRGLLGASTEKGKRADASAYPLLGLAVADPKRKSPMPIEEVQMRCSLQLINEAMHCLGEGILRSARDGDIGAIFGLGFPPFRGGPFRYVDSIGAVETLRRIDGYAQRFGKRWAPAPALVELARSGKRFYTSRRARGAGILGRDMRFRVVHPEGSGVSLTEASGRSSGDARRGQRRPRRTSFGAMRVCCGLVANAARSGQAR